MIDRFTQKAREAIRLAVETAQELEHGYVGTEHLLLGLIKEGTGVAAAVLAEHDVTEERVMELMERLISPAVATQVEGQIEYTPGARAVLQASYDEADFFQSASDWNGAHPDCHHQGWKINCVPFTQYNEC